MFIDEIEGDSVANILENWDSLYEMDPESHLFLTHEWLRSGLTYRDSKWLVLGAKYRREDERYVALLPIRIEARFDEQQGFFYNKIDLAGANFSDYVGILVDPAAEADALPTLARHICSRMNWAIFGMDNLLMSERRLKMFRSGFKAARLQRQNIEYIDKHDRTNHGICPFITLPASWDAYLDGISANNRQKIRRLLRKVEGSGTCRIAFSNTADHERDIDMLLGYWRTKWSPRKGENTDPIIARNRCTLLECSERGDLLLPVFWHGDRPIAALALLVDRRKRSLLFLITGRDESYEEMPSGYLLHAFAIRHAIAEGFLTYDFLMGNEPYKFLFTSQTQVLNAMLLKAKSSRNFGRKLDLRCLPEMVAIAIRLEDDDEIDRAERAYQEILTVAADHELVTYRLGRMLAKRGSHLAAKPYLLRLIEAEPEGDNAWLWLARTLQTLGEGGGAIDAYRKVIALQGENEEAKEQIVRLARSAKTKAGYDAIFANSSLVLTREEADPADPTTFLQGIIRQSLTQQSSAE